MHGIYPEGAIHPRYITQIVVSVGTVSAIHRSISGIAGLLGDMSATHRGAMDVSEILRPADCT